MFKDRLKKLRTDAGLTQSELAEKLDLSASTISMYEQGRRYADQETLVRLSKLFDVSTDYILATDNKLNNVDRVTDEEANELYEMFEQLDEEGKEIISMMINKLIDKKK